MLGKSLDDFIAEEDLEDQSEKKQQTGGYRTSTNAASEERTAIPLGQHLRCWCLHPEQEEPLFLGCMNPFYGYHDTR